MVEGIVDSGFLEHLWDLWLPRLGTWLLLGTLLYQASAFFSGSPTRRSERYTGRITLAVSGGTLGFVLPVLFVAPFGGRNFSTFSKGILRQVGSEVSCRRSRP